MDISSHMVKVRHFLSKFSILVTSQKNVFLHFLMHQEFLKKFVLQILPSNLNHHLFLKFWINLYFWISYSLKCFFFIDFLKIFICFPFKLIQSFENMTKKKQKVSNYNTQECDLKTRVSDFKTHECDATRTSVMQHAQVWCNTQKSDFYKKRAISTCRVRFPHLRV
jgi:hypothetical protein